MGREWSKWLKVRTIGGLVFLVGRFCIERFFAGRFRLGSEFARCAGWFAKMSKKWPKMSKNVKKGKNG